MALELQVNNAMSHPLTVSHNYDSMVWCKSHNQRANFVPTLNNQEAKTPSTKQPQKLDIVWLKCGLLLQLWSRLSVHTHAVVAVKSVLENLVRVVALEWRITWTLLPMRKKKKLKVCNVCAPFLQLTKSDLCPNLGLKTWLSQDSSLFYKWHVYQ